MSTLTSFPKHRHYGPTDRQLAAARRRMTRARNLDRLSFRYRHVLRILQGTGAVVILIGLAEVVPHLIGA